MYRILNNQKTMSPIDHNDFTLPWLWLGTWSLGGEGFGPHHGGEALATLEAALEAGIRCFDTAGFYAHGRSEQLLSKLIAQEKRQKFFIASKGGLFWQGKNVIHCANRHALRETLFSSLERLKTDYLDLYQLHWPDPQTPIEDSLEALHALQEEGLILHWGVCNFSVEQIQTYLPSGALVPHQVHHNPLHRADAILEAGKTNQRCLNCITSPLEQGLLGTGRSAQGLAVLGKRDVRRRNPLFHSQQVQMDLNRLIEKINSTGLPQVSAVFLELLSSPSVDIVISGARTRKQLAEVLAHQDWLRFWGINLEKRQDKLLLSEKLRQLRVKL
jgi:aryl-alcohol dehydrogenase-like predicted oxidoreductase